MIRVRTLLGAAFVLVSIVSTIAVAYQADLVPVTGRVEGRAINGMVSITGADGTVHVKIENVDAPNGDDFSGALTAQLRLRVNGIRRRVTMPLAVDAGDGDASVSLGLRADDRIVVLGVRVRDTDHRTLAEAGAVTADVASAPPPSPVAPADCPPALDQCQSDLADCTDELASCENDTGL